MARSPASQTTHGKVANELPDTLQAAIALHHKPWLCVTSIIDGSDTLLQGMLS